MKFRLRKLDCALTWCENAVPQLRNCVALQLNQKAHCGSCAGLQKSKKFNCAFCAALSLVEKIIWLCCAFDIMLFLPTSVEYQQYVQVIDLLGGVYTFNKTMWLTINGIPYLLKLTKVTVDSIVAAQRRKIVQGKYYSMDCATYVRVFT